jgi:hypothetical protein
MILLYKGKSTISKLIKWQTFGSYSHAAWWLRDGTVVEAWHKGGVSHNDSPATLHTPGTEIDIFDFDCTAGFQPALAEQFLINQVGKKYDFAPVMRGFIFRVMRDNPLKWFCSELVHAAARAGNLELLSRVPDWKIHPTLLSYSPRMIHVATITTIDHKDFNIRTVDSVLPPANRQPSQRRAGLRECGATKWQSPIGNHQCP